ncbi:hypothetical protein CLOM_g10659 [Closterium sp. NIES-68]|nr:hypothetical protein CLOM_g10659 [Closterium sp. NIES-68]
MSSSLGGPLAMKRPNVARLQIPVDASCDKDSTFESTQKQIAVRASCDKDPVPATSTNNGAHSIPDQPGEQQTANGVASFSISQAARGEVGETSEISDKCRNFAADSSAANPADPPPPRSASKHRRAASVSRPAWLLEEQICAALSAPPPPAAGAPSPRNAASAAAASPRRSCWAIASPRVGAHGMAEGFGAWGTRKGDLCDSRNSSNGSSSSNGGYSRYSSRRVADKDTADSISSDPLSVRDSGEGSRCITRTSSSINRVRPSFSADMPIFNKGGGDSKGKSDRVGEDEGHLQWPVRPLFASRSESSESYPCLATPRANRARRRSFASAPSGNQDGSLRPALASRLSLSESSKSLPTAGTDGAAAAAADGDTASAATAAAAAAAAAIPVSAFSQSASAPTASLTSPPTDVTPSASGIGSGAETPRQRAARSIFPRAVSTSSVHVSSDSAGRGKGGGDSGANRRRGCGRVAGRAGSSPLQPSLLQAAVSISTVDAPAAGETCTRRKAVSQTGAGLGRRGSLLGAQRLGPLPELRQLSGLSEKVLSGISSHRSVASHRERRCGQEEEEEEHQHLEIFEWEMMVPRQQQQRQLQRGLSAPCDEIDGSVFEMLDPVDVIGPDPPIMDGLDAPTGEAEQ